MHRSTLTHRTLSTALALLLGIAPAAAATLARERLAVPGAAQATPRTLMVALQVDRNGARLVGYAVKERSFRPAPDAARHHDGLEVALIGGDGRRFLAHADLAALCLEHDGDTAPHIEGDTIQLHRDSVIVELPALEGASELQVTGLAGESALLPTALAIDLGRGAEFLAGGTESHLATSGAVHWPEEYNDAERYTVYGNAAEASSRINIVIVPDGYTYAEKSLMKSHADQLVAYFRGKTPYMEHDALLNYTLVYAFSTQSGTDQCDCSTVVDTAMNTRFPDRGYGCGNSGNRCLYYGTANGGPNCDETTSDVNIAAAELRAPARDYTLVMVNSVRSGGCGGLRAVFSFTGSSAAEIAVHELGHTLAGLADEYGGNPSCGSATGVNVSTDSSTGNWPEWIAELGSPVAGGKLYDSCIYRPAASCDMRSLGVPFCPVCTQKFALSFFGHNRVSPTAPLLGQSPESPATVGVGFPATFSVATRLAIGPGVTNSFTWRLQGPGETEPTVVATGSPEHSQLFATPGTYTLTCEIVAVTNFVKPEKTAGNRDLATWTINTGDCDAPPVFAGIASARDLDVCEASGIELAWADASFETHGGSYDVWRDGERIASDLTALTYLDLPGDDREHAYRVAAVSGDCRLGDGNTLELTAHDGRSVEHRAVCGNLVCEAGDGEDCLSCPSDCAGKQDGKWAGRFCCGDGDGASPVGCGDTRCAQGGRSCTSAPVPPTGTCCGNGICEPGESCASCLADCAPARESCSGGKDEDCDGQTDCRDSDCFNDPICVGPECRTNGLSCSVGSECCSGRCDKRKRKCY